MFLFPLSPDQPSISLSSSPSLLFDKPSSLPWSCSHSVKQPERNRCVTAAAVVWLLTLLPAVSLFIPPHVSTPPQQQPQTNCLYGRNFQGEFNPAGQELQKDITWTRSQVYFSVGVVYDSLLIYMFRDSVTTTTSQAHTGCEEAITKPNLRNLSLCPVLSPFLSHNPESQLKSSTCLLLFHLPIEKFILQTIRPFSRHVSILSHVSRLYLSEIL